MATRGEAALARLAARTTEVRAARTAERRAAARYQAAILAARNAGVPLAEVARVARVSKGRVVQVAPSAGTLGHARQARKQAPVAVRVAPEDTLPTLAGTGEGGLSGVVSVRERRRYGRATMFYDVGTGAACTEAGVMIPGDSGPDAGTLGDVLAACRMGDEVPRRVFLTGPTPLDLSGGATHAEAVRAWTLGALPPGWAVDPAGHYLHDPDRPTMRFLHDDGQAVAIMRAAAWWGETDASVETCAAAWRGLGVALDAVPVFRGAGLADSPATAGRALWARTIPEGRGWPVLSDGFRDLITATAGQGRQELRPAAAPTLDGFAYLDGRFMYAALTWGMPVGEPVMVTGASFASLSAAATERALRGRGRWLVRATVPADWRHVGLLMAPGDGPDRGGWVYPSTPGQTFSTWADGSEVWLAKSHGWHVEVVEGFRQDEGKPLDSWQAALVRVWRQATVAGTPASLLAARAVRSILLYALGAFATRAHPATGTTPADRPEDVPDDVVPGSVRRVGDSLVWERLTPLSAFTTSKQHPEWSATVWARARARLAARALTVPLGQVVAFATDALYLGADPGWDDSGAPGEFRVKGRIDGYVRWPTNHAELYALRDKSEQEAAR